MTDPRDIAVQNQWFGDALRPALVPLRGSIRFAFLGLATIAIAGGAE